MTATWLELGTTAFGRKTPPPAALFGADELDAMNEPLFAADGEPTPQAVAPLPAAERAALEAERAVLVARLAYLDDLLGK